MSKHTNYHNKIANNAYENDILHAQNVLRYQQESQPKKTTTFKTDKDLLREHHQFVRNDEDDKQQGTKKFEQVYAKKYYDKLYKEFAIADLSRYKERKMGLRWRSEKEVVAGKGQKLCAEVKCNATQELQAMEVDFAYREHGENKNTLVKVVLCPSCTEKMNKVQKKKRKRRESSEEENDELPASKKLKESVDNDEEEMLRQAKERIKQLEQELNL